MNKIKIAILISLAFALLIGGGFGVHYYLLDRAYSSRLAEYQRTYFKDLEDLIDSPCSPDASHDIHAFLSTSTFNEVLATLVGKPIAMDKRTTLTLSTLKLEVMGGTPMLAVKGALAFGGGKPSVEVEGVATIAPLVARGDSFFTRLHIVSLKPTFASGKLRLAVRGFFGDLVKAIGQEQLDKLPEIQLPLSSEFKIPIAGSQKNISIPTRPPEADKLNGILRIPDFRLSAALVIDKAFFLSDGLHVLLAIDGHKISDCADPDWKALDSKARLLRIGDDSHSYFARVNHQAVNALALRLLNLPSDSRSVTFQSTGLDGHFYYWDRVQRGPLGVGVLYREEKKVYLDRANGATARAEVKGLRIAPITGALTSVVLQVGLSGHVQLHWHYDPGPTGGVGGNIGISLPAQDIDISGSIRIAGSEIEGYLNQPQPIRIQLQAGLGSLGQMGFSVNVPLPKDRLFSATIPTGLKEQISFKVGEAEIRRRIILSNLEVRPTPYGIVASGMLALGDAH
jgi:hypothetical protein